MICFYYTRGYNTLETITQIKRFNECILLVSRLGIIIITDYVFCKIVVRLIMVWQKYFKEIAVNIAN